MKDKILSVQSKLVYGYVGSNVAEFAIQLHGLDVIAFPTVYLSAHTGHQPVYGTKIEDKLFKDLITGVKNLDILDSIAHIITGYIGAEDILRSTTDLIREIKDKYPDRLYVCDPVMGDDVGLYIEESLAKKIITDLIPLCDLMTPNLFEFEYIVGRKTNTIKEVVDAIAEHPILKEKKVVITSCNLEETPKNKINTLIVADGKPYCITTDKVDIDTTGTGDLFTSVTASQLALGKDVVLAVTEAAHIVTRALSYTVEAGNEEMNAKSILQAIKI